MKTLVGALCAACTASAEMIQKWYMAKMVQKTITLQTRLLVCQGKSLTVLKAKQMISDLFD